MIKRILTLFCLICSIGLNAQTGIGTTTPNVSAKLDVYSDNKGFLPPRVTLTSASDNSTIASPAEGLLVYNKGSVGLQAGYYYWNGANWATIATATSAGNGVTASNLVNLYSKAYSTAVGDIAEANGFSFTVPVSGRYLFDFTSTGYANSATVTMTFKVRQGTTDIGTDAQTSSNNTVHVEYNGKVEVNLQAGTTYNVNVTTTGVRNSADYDRVYYKMVAGNLPVTGQTVDYVSVTRTTTQTVVAGNNVIFDQINGGNIPYNSSTGNFTLTAGKTYRMTGYISLSSTNAGAEEVNVAWKTAAGDVLLNKGELLSTSFGTTAAASGIADVIYTPSVNTTVSLSVMYTSAGAILWGNFTYANIQQIGSSAIVNPWVLSGNDVYNTTGEVGIGTNAPDASAILDVSSTSKGILIPRMTASQKSAIASPATGLLIYQTDASTGFYYYNGSSWMGISEPNWTSAGTIQSVGWGATTTAPTIGTTSVNDFSYKQIGAKTWKCQLTYSAGSNPTGMNIGSGDYLFTLPNGLQFNTSLVGQATYTGDVGSSTWNWLNVCLSNSSGTITNNAQGGQLLVVPYSSTQFRLIHVGLAGTGFVIPYASGYYGVGASIGWRVTFTFQSL